MSVRVTTLGGSAAWPNPGQGCSSYLVTAGDSSILLDCGPDTLHVLRSVTDFTRLSGIVISHFHADHTLDLVPYRYGLVHGPFEIENRIPLWLPPGGHDFLSGIARAVGAAYEDPEEFWNGAFDVHIYEPGVDFSIDDLTISTMPTQHFIDCYAARIQTRNGKRIVYTADTGTVDPLVPFAAGADLLIAEATLRDHGDTPISVRGHLTPGDAADLAVRSNVQSLLLTHLWSERPDDEVLDAANAYQGEVRIAKAGLVIDV